LRERERERERERDLVFIDWIESEENETDVEKRSGRGIAFHRGIEFQWGNEIQGNQNPKKREVNEGLATRV
jgi:hypothetical protein